AAGLVRADLSALQGTTVSGPLTGAGVAEATPANGPLVKTERAFRATVAADGSLIASYGLTLKPGQYALRVFVPLEGGKGATATAPLAVPDFEAPGLHLAPLLLYPDEP